MRLYDTARQEVVPFEPGPVVTMYTCGITPYDATHLGHASTYVVYDVLQRRLRDMGHETKCVRNVTDVDDDILRKARELGVHYLDLAAAETARFDGDMVALGMLASWSEPRATSAIPDIRGFIGMVLDRGHAYQAGGAVYFDVTTFPHFGQVSHLDEATMLALARENGGNPDDPHKRQPLDFVLWQPSAPDEPSWESLWGPGRPGWHIECSALALRELGTTIDLHGGGRDLVFPHHECEAAQSEAATGERFVRHWLHAPLVQYEGTKMSKSLGNLVFVSDLVKEWEPAAIRLAIAAHHYRNDWTWTDDLMPTAAARLEAWQTAGEGEAGLDEVRAALDDDLDTPRAVAAIDEAAAAGRGVSQAAALLGVELLNGAAWALLGAAAVLAIGNWVAVDRGHRHLEWACKPATLALLIGVALAVDPTDDGQRAWFVVALVLSLAGDVFLMLPKERFVEGLGSFLLGHVAYVVGLGQEASLGPLLVGAVAVSFVTVAVGRRVLAAVQAGDEPSLGAPVALYMAVISAMVATAVGTLDAVAIGGAALFFLSDALIAWNRFVEPVPRARLAIMVTYHLGQAGLVLSLLA